MNKEQVHHHAQTPGDWSGRLADQSHSDHRIDIPAWRVRSRGLPFGRARMVEPASVEANTYRMARD